MKKRQYRRSANPALTRYALLDNGDGFIWWVGDAESPEAACAAATLEFGGERRAYEKVYEFKGDVDGYYVYEAPAGFNVHDGQDQGEIEAVTAMPLAGGYAETDEKTGWE